MTLPRKPSGDPVKGAHFEWIVYRRPNGFFYADGRSNRPNLGRHSLGTQDRSKAIEQVRALDHVKAIEHGRVAPPASSESPMSSVSLEEGQEVFLRYSGRVDGAKAKSVQRYKAVLEKFIRFVRSQQISGWQQVTKFHLAEYAIWLKQARHGTKQKPYKKRTLVFEQIVLAQVLKLLAEMGRIKPVDLKGVRLKKVTGTDAYCYSDAEIDEMFRYCGSKPALAWIKGIIVTLANTGMRIGELKTLRWDDVDLERCWATLRNTKNGKDRRIKLLPDVVDVLNSLVRSADGLVFHGSHGGMLKPDAVRKAFVRDVLHPVAESSKTVGPDFHRGRLHTFRHYHCSWLTANGVEGRTIQLLMGHASSVMVAHYTHQNDPIVSEEFSKLPSLVHRTPERGERAGKPTGRRRETPRHGGGKPSS